MSTKHPRGTKRTCQSNECGARFYDLARNPIVCPMCGSVYDLASSPAAAAALAAEEKALRGKPKKVEYVLEKAPAIEPEAEVEEALADIVPGEEEEEIAAEPDETFLEEEEETPGGDVSNIIGGPVTEGGEEP